MKRLTQFLLAVALLCSPAFAQNLLEIRLPAGEVPGFDIMFSGWTGQNRQKYSTVGFDGIRFVGKGADRTHIVPDYKRDDGSVVTGESTINVGRFAGIVEFEGVTLHCSDRKGLFVGTPNNKGPLIPLGLVLKDFNLVADAPPEGSNRPYTTVWGISTYQTSIHWDGGVVDMRYSAEHALYDRGFSPGGILIENVDVRSVGAEGFKFTARPNECLYVPDILIWIRNCSFRDWYQPHSWRGGAGITVQGSSANVLIEDCMFYGGEQSRSRCIMIDDSGPNFYSADDGTPGQGPANGWVIVKDCGLYGEGTANKNPIMRIGTLRTLPNGKDDPSAIVSRGTLILNSGLYGKDSLASFGGIQTADFVLVHGCNTPAIRDIAESRGFDVTHETLLHYGPNLTPISEGRVLH